MSSSRRLSVPVWQPISTRFRVGSRKRHEGDELWPGRRRSESARAIPSASVSGRSFLTQAAIAERATWSMTAAVSLPTFAVSGFLVGSLSAGGSGASGTACRSPPPMMRATSRMTSFSIRPSTSGASSTCQNSTFSTHSRSRPRKPQARFSAHVNFMGSEAGATGNGSPRSSGRKRPGQAHPGE